MDTVFIGLANIVLLAYLISFALHRHKKGPVQPANRSYSMDDIRKAVIESSVYFENEAKNTQ